MVPFLFPFPIRRKKTSGTVESPRERMLNGFAHEFLLHFYIIAISGPMLVPCPSTIQIER
jgi:hypothetical protein